MNKKQLLDLLKDQKYSQTKNSNRIVKLEDFFDFNSNKPINRLAYTEEDMKYKIKVIEVMKKLGMDMTVDKAGNICGTIKVRS
ncbi:MAG: hypothetical protein K2H53_00110 [Clostridia bacterium]|nr:hypothetical protein [Clostridia bacterium]